MAIPFIWARRVTCLSTYGNPESVTPVVFIRPPVLNCPMHLLAFSKVTFCSPCKIAKIMRSYRKGLIRMRGFSDLNVNFRIRRRGFFHSRQRSRGSCSSSLGVADPASVEQSRPRPKVVNFLAFTRKSEYSEVVQDRGSPMGCGTL